MTHDPPPKDPGTIARDWITIWQSELNAAVHDRELLEMFANVVDHWAKAAQFAASLLPSAPPAGRDPASGRAGSGPSPGAAPAAAAPDARDLAIQRLGERVAELERIIAGVSQPPEPRGPDGGTAS